jgi:hypothetical protein
MNKRSALPGRPIGGRDKRPRRTPMVMLGLDAIPRATYRVQLHREFRFADVTALVRTWRRSASITSTARRISAPDREASMGTTLSTTGC